MVYDEQPVRHARALANKKEKRDRGQSIIRNVNLKLRVPAARIALAVATAVTQPPLAPWNTKQCVLMKGLSTDKTTSTRLAVCAICVEYCIG